MKEELYQKTGLIVSRLAQELMGYTVQNRIPSISFFEEKFQVSRGTIQNAFSFLKQANAIELVNKGKLGTYLQSIDYRILQQYSIKDSLMGIMPLPYSKLYEGLASALYEELKDSTLNFNMAYMHGAESRISLVVKGAYDFAVCSLFAAQQAIQSGQPIKILCDFGESSYLSKHVLVMHESYRNGIQDGMKVGYDSNSIDQREITLELTKKLEHITLVPTHSHQIVSNIVKRIIDAGVWNYDEIQEHSEYALQIVELKQMNLNQYTTAVIVIKEQESALEHTLMQRLDKERIRDVQAKVRSGELIPSY